MTPDCPALTLNPFTTHPWPTTIFMTVVMIGLVVFFIRSSIDSRRWHREQAARDAVRVQLWAERDPEGYALIMEQRAEEESLVAARLAQYQPWWRHRHRRSQA